MGNDPAYDDEHLVPLQYLVLVPVVANRRLRTFFSHNIYTTMTMCLEAILKYDPGCAIQISSLV